MASSKELRVGAFVLAGLIVAGIVVFLIGDEKRLFDSKVMYHTSFSDVQGLKAGAPVRLGGVDIGTVSHVHHSENPTDNRIYLDLRIVKSEAVRVRRDTVARVVNKGLLGDKMIELTEGASTSPQLPPDSDIRGEDPTDFASLFSEVGNMTHHAEKILANLEVTSQALADEGMQQDLKGSVRSMNLLLKEVAEGKGYLHRLLTDPGEADRVSHLVADADHVAVELNQTLAETHKAVARVNQGPGFAHELLYGEKGSESLAQFGGAAGEVAVTLRGIREGNGLMHSVLYGGKDDDSQRVAANLGAMTGDMRQIVADLRAGKGTLGALLVDPSVYEDVKRLVGDVGRNDVLRALVRYSIKQDEKRPQLQVSGPPSPQSPTPAAPSPSN
jgi:phospholipid/cholesterol/gamma-HCH transport system substrate-binding protein